LRLQLRIWNLWFEEKQVSSLKCSPCDIIQGKESNIVFIHEDNRILSLFTNGNAERETED
jgi:hypothetical protein